MDAIKRCSECTVSVLYKRKACVSQCCGLYRVIPVQAKGLCFTMLRIVPCHSCTSERLVLHNAADFGAPPIYSCCFVVVVVFCCKSRQVL